MKEDERKLKDPMFALRPWQSLTTAALIVGVGGLGVSKGSTGPLLLYCQTSGILDY